MALSADQRAMLQLLLERGQSYDDLASVLGVGVDEVRTRARAALTELAGGADPDAEVGLTDYLLRQADPIGRADAVRHLQADPESHRLASDLRDRLLEISPDPRLPELPAPKGRRRTAPQAPTRPRGTMTPRQQQTIVALVAAAVLVLVGILAVAGGHRAARSGR